MSGPPCLPKLTNNLQTDRSAAEDGLTHTIGSRTLPSGNIIEVNYKDNRNTFTDQFAAFGTVTLTNVTDKPRKIRYRYRGASAKRTKGAIGTPFIISPTTQDGFSLDVCIDEIDGVVMSVVAPQIPAETTKIIDFSILVTFDESVNQWDRNDDGVVDTTDLALLMAIGGIDTQGINMCVSLMDFAMPEAPEEPVEEEEEPIEEEEEEEEANTSSEYPIEIRFTMNALPNNDNNDNHYGIPMEDITFETIAGPLVLAGDTGAAGEVGFVANSYGYSSINVKPSDEEQTTAEWVLANPDTKWKAVLMRDGEILKTVEESSMNPPDNTNHYGDGVWFRKVLNQDEYQIGDEWILYGY